MTDPGEDLLTTTEGVDEGSADSAVEGAASTTGLDPVQPDAGPADRPAVPSESTPAPPVDTATDQPIGPGQQLEAGEG